HFIANIRILFSPYAQNFNVNCIMIAFQKVVNRLFPAGLPAESCSLLQLGEITIWLSNFLSKADEMQVS
ncbi:MAG: hypothetical protein PHV03_11190, partial [Desulfitobacteriaceae bacterium]|nr:hypothetical protein [Desulfitobacteriaceae bacterium]